MVTKKTTELKRVLCKVTELGEFTPNQIFLDQKSMALLELNNSIIATNYGLIKINENHDSSIDYTIKIATNLSQNFGISNDNYLEIFNIDGYLFFTPILSDKLTEHFFTLDGSQIPNIILLSSHAEFEPYTREIATGIHSRLQELSLPTLRIKIHKRLMEGNPIIDATISRYEVDITRNEEEPQIIARKLVNKNSSYRILARTYFDLLSTYLSLDRKCIVVDIHGIATASPKGILHPMIIIGDALSHNLAVENFTKFIEKSSRTFLPNPWIVYRSKWGAVEYTLHLVKETQNIPVIIEIRRDLRDDPDTRSKLINLISNALYNLIQTLSLNG